MSFLWLIFSYFHKNFWKSASKNLSCQIINNKSLGLNFFRWSIEKFNQSEQHPQENEKELVIARILSYFAVRVFRFEKQLPERVLLKGCSFNDKNVNGCFYVEFFCLHIRPWSTILLLQNKNIKNNCQFIPSPLHKR